ncbi:MAG TPA: D-amino acid aminotransferase, partial [Polyangia bacterium]|nr:D-amino acid aminotransferase [Polyangia bacterium]
NGLRLVEVRMFPAELRAAEEAFITSATRGVLPVTRIDDKPVGDGAPGPVTRKLMALYEALARAGVP